ncbi:uncharacterized protein A1O5_09938 [Cladophialophora psammophila CBS 110553]|uniref:Uncharacterized protein n=1 Tax=Cladophialophora psammophila CBS 110553 TaxID=1182543 RepID=W9WFL1_9EURO|nr:uncharacterized protein A1O5_09938 [Cladophialophora psammophila CBS 110553]EXJ66743.1 hypothetical protein A1O5_09938 [Cladophialophora psammophila CBS 110553]
MEFEEREWELARWRLDMDRRKHEAERRLRSFIDLADVVEIKDEQSEGNQTDSQTTVGNTPQPPLPALETPTPLTADSMDGERCNVLTSKQQHAAHEISASKTIQQPQKMTSHLQEASHPLTDNIRTLMSATVNSNANLAIHTPSAAESRNQENNISRCEHLDFDDLLQSSSEPLEPRGSTPPVRAPKRRAVSMQEPRREIEALDNCLKNKLISHYKDLLLKHFQESGELGRCEDKVPGRTQVGQAVMDVRRTIKGRRYESLSDVHDEFSRKVESRVLDRDLRRSVQEELGKFVQAGQHWWAQCTAMTTQQERLSFVTSVVQEIAMGQFEAV